jgi:N-acetylglutamate synthase
MTADRDPDIRTMQAADYDAVCALWTAAGLGSIRRQGRDSSDAMQRQLAHPETVYLVAEDRGRIVGVVLGTHDQRKGWINRLAVHPDYRRQGLARRLIATCEAALLAQGIRIIAALVEPGNASSMQLFESAGYAEYEGIRYYRKKRDQDV